MWLLLTPSAGWISQLPCWPRLRQPQAQLHHHPAPLRFFPCTSSPHLSITSCPTKRGQGEGSFMSVPKSHLPGVLHFAPGEGEGSYGLLPLDNGQAGSFSLLKLGAVGVRTQGPLSTTPRGERAPGNIWPHPDPWPRSPGPVACRPPGQCWQRAVLTASALTFLFQKEVLRKSAHPYRRGLPEGDMGGGRLHRGGDCS